MGSSQQSCYQSTHGYSIKHVNSVYSVNSYYCELCECGVKMASILKEHMEKEHSSHLMKPLMAAAGAVLAWKYLPSMTEELWNHALLFLDRHRAEEDNRHEITDLYQFQDPTGILEKHKQLLFQPFNENKVDMKIIYYELIKMLIDYERRNNPAAYDATKSVGKIDGYQELTNKLQRFLNQRFILDIQRLSKTCEDMPANVSGTLEKLEGEFNEMKKSQDSLEERNQALMIEIVKIKEREAELTKKLEVFESIELSMDESNRKLVERIECIELDGRKIDEGLVELKHKQGLDILKLTEDIKKNKLDAQGLIEDINTKVETREKVTKKTWKAFEQTLCDHETKISDIQSLNEERNSELRNKVNQIFENEKNISKKLEEKETNLKSVNVKVAEHASIFKRNNVEEMSSSITRLKDEIQKNFVKIQEIDSLKRTVDFVEETRQQSIAQVNDEVRETTKNNLNQIENMKNDIDKKVKTLHEALKTNSALNDERVNTLQTEMSKSSQSSKESIKAAEDHVENLRLLNRTLIDQLNEKSTKENDAFKKRIKTDVEKSMSNLKGALSCEIESLFKKLSSSNNAITDLTNNVDILTRQLTTMVGNEEKIKDIVNTIENNQRIEQNNNKAKFTAIESENENINTKISELKQLQEVHQKTTCDGIAVLRDSYNEQISQYKNSTTDQSKLLATTNEKLVAIMETAGGLLSEYAVQEKKIIELEKNGKDLDKKITDLESAELFLQEAQRKVVERTTASDEYMKSIEKDLVKITDVQKADLMREIKSESQIFNEKLNNVHKVLETKIKGYEQKQNGTEAHVSKVNMQLENFEITKKSMKNQIEILTKDKEIYTKQVNQLKPMMDALEEKICCMEEGLRNDLENLSKENAKNISEAKNDNNINNKCMLMNTKGMEESFNDLKTELETLQKTQIIEKSKSKRLEEKLGDSWLS